MAIKNGVEGLFLNRSIRRIVGKNLHDAKFLDDSSRVNLFLNKFRIERFKNFYQANLKWPSVKSLWKPSTLNVHKTKGLGNGGRKTNSVDRVCFN